VFEPRSAGAQRSLVALRDSASDKVQIVELSGRGTVVALSPNRLSFAPQIVGTKSSPQQISITNEGATPLTISSIRVEGADPKDFTVSGTVDCTGQSLAAGATCNVAVVFSPTKTGALRATIYVYDSGKGSPETAEVAGTGT
jgi:uncharacterized OB-fold protein